MLFSVLKCTESPQHNVRHQWLHFIGRADNPYCPCDNQTIQSGDHITFSCSLHAHADEGSQRTGNHGNNWTPLSGSRRAPTNERTGSSFSSHIYFTNSSELCCFVSFRSVPFVWLPLFCLACFVSRLCFVLFCFVFVLHILRSARNFIGWKRILGTIELRGNPINWPLNPPSIRRVAYHKPSRLTCM